MERSLLGSRSAVQDGKFFLGPASSGLVACLGGLSFIMWGRDFGGQLLSKQMQYRFLLF